MSFHLWVTWRDAYDPVKQNVSMHHVGDHIVDTQVTGGVAQIDRKIKKQSKDAFSFGNQQSRSVFTTPHPFLLMKTSVHPSFVEPSSWPTLPESTHGSLLQQSQDERHQSGQRQHRRSTDDRHLTSRRG
jgi:hypothetical protein